MNEDFSFVRFLKVVKTLYESSTFTQLGRTVGSALGPNVLTTIRNDSGVIESEEDNMERDEKLQRSLSRDGSTLFDALVDACTPGRQKLVEDFNQSNTLTTLEEKKLDELAPHEVESLFERVINCTLLGSHEDEDLLSCDDDTFRTQTYDDHSMEESFNDVDSYDLSEEDYRESRRSPRRRSRRSSRRRR